MHPMQVSMLNKLIILLEYSKLKLSEISVLGWAAKKIIVALSQILYLKFF